MTATRSVRSGSHTTRTPSSPPILPTSILPALPKSKYTLSPLDPLNLTQCIQLLRVLYLPPVHGGICGDEGGDDEDDYEPGSQRGSGVDLGSNGNTEVNVETLMGSLDGLGLDVGSNCSNTPDQGGFDDSQTKAEAYSRAEDNYDGDPAPHLDPFERDYSENWLNGIVRRAQGWIEDQPDIEHHTGIEAVEGDEGWSLRSYERILKESTAVLAMMAGTSGTSM
jgi:hypothetical protein